MTKHKTEDYKISAVKYYFNNENGDRYKKTCKIFDCKKSTIRDFIKKYKKETLSDNLKIDNFINSLPTFSWSISANLIIPATFIFLFFSV